MKIILLKDISKVGQQYDVKEVASGYALNFLIPQSLAKIVTPGELKRIEKLKAEQSQKIKSQVDGQKKKIKEASTKKIELKWQANEKGHFFKGVQKEDIAEALKSQGISIEPEFIFLDKPIKEVGDYEIEIKAFDLKSKVKVSIKPA